MLKIQNFLNTELKNYKTQGGSDMYAFFNQLKLSNLGIKFNYDATTLPHKNRMVLFTKRSATINDFKSMEIEGITADDILKECNGLVLDYGLDFKVLCYPPPAPKNIDRVTDTRLVFDNFNKYKATVAPIGTVISIYNYNGTWLISSLQSYDLTHYTMRGFEYTNIFNRIDTSNLDHKFSYTIGFRTPEMHYSNSTLMWFIAMTNLNTLEVSYEKPEYLEYLNDTREIKIHSSDDIKNWIIYNGGDVAPQGSAGILLRTTCENIHQCIFIETEFAQNFRKLIYDMYVFNRGHSQKNHRKYSLLKMWISNVKPDNVRLLDIPNLTSYYIKWDRYISEHHESIPELFEIKNNRIANAIKSSVYNARKILKKLRYFDSWYFHIFTDKTSPIYVKSINLTCRTF
jgi:hypothetical protein